jgi:pimeloyl-ACP methyl ester carboxylesterase
VAVAGAAISVHVEQGSGRPVVFLHGNSSTKAVWTHQITLARQLGRSILAPDLPGHGESEDSPTPNLTYSFPGYASVVGGLLDRFHVDAADVVGWSLGGHIGLQLFATDERIRSLLVVGTPPARPAPEALEQAFYTSDDMQLAGKDKFTPADAVAYGTAMMGGRKFLSSELLQNIRRADGNARRHMFASALRGVGIDQRAAAESIDKPLCVVHGEREPFVRLDYLRSLKYRALWKNRIFVISGAGHAPHWENPAAFNRILSGFLRFAQSQGGAGGMDHFAVANGPPCARYYQDTPSSPGRGGRCYASKNL